MTPEADFLVLAPGARWSNSTDPAGPVTCARGVGRVRCEGVSRQSRRRSRATFDMVEARTAGCAAVGERTRLAVPGRAGCPHPTEALAGPVLVAFAHSSPVRSRRVAGHLPRLRRLRVVSITQAGLGTIEICPPGVTRRPGVRWSPTPLGVDPLVCCFRDMPTTCDVRMAMEPGRGGRRPSVGTPQTSTRAEGSEALRDGGDPSLRSEDSLARATHVLCVVARSLSLLSVPISSGAATDRGCG